jgi:hypothetical protein
VVGVDRLVDVRPGRVHDLLVGSADPLQQHHRRGVDGAGRVVDAELDVGQHPVGVGVSDQHGAGDPGRGLGEHVAVDDAHAGLDGIDAESRPHHVEERHRRQHLAGHASIVEQAPHRTLEHQR